MSRKHPWAERYRKLRGLLPDARSLREVDKDWSALTSDRPRAREVRKFFLGEVFVVYHNSSTFFRDSGTVALVTKKQQVAAAPVTMAPVSDAERPDEWIFSTGIENGEQFDFLLFYRRPVNRSQIGRHLGTAGAQEKQRLAAEMHLVLGSAW